VNFAGGKTIQEADVELLVKANVNSNIFATIDALGNSNKREALKLLHRHLVNGDDPFYILSMFIYQFRNLVKIADLQENQGVGEFEIAKLAKLHPFVVKKSLSQLRNFPWEKLKKTYQKLAELDAKVKTGKIEIKLALDKFIVEL
jgi:DNA polymerase-3 subunit delta